MNAFSPSTWLRSFATWRGAAPILPMPSSGRGRECPCRPSEPFARHAMRSHCESGSQASASAGSFRRKPPLPSGPTFLVPHVAFRRHWRYASLRTAPGRPVPLAAHVTRSVVIAALQPAGSICVTGHLRPLPRRQRLKAGCTICGAQSSGCVTRGEVRLIVAGWLSLQVEI